MNVTPCLGLKIGYDAMFAQTTRWVVSSASSSMGPEPILAPLIMRRRLKHVCHYPSLGPIRYKKLEKVTDVRYESPLLPTVVGCLVYGTPYENLTPRATASPIRRLRRRSEIFASF